MKMIVLENDVVLASEDVNDYIRKGCVGTVVHVLDQLSNTCLVEFVNEKNETIDVVEVNIDSLELAER